MAMFHFPHHTGYPFCLGGIQFQAAVLLRKKRRFFQQENLISPPVNHFFRRPSIPLRDFKILGPKSMEAWQLGYIHFHRNPAIKFVAGRDLFPEIGLLLVDLYADKKVSVYVDLLIDFANDLLPLLLPGLFISLTPLLPSAVLIASHILSRWWLLIASRDYGDGYGIGAIGVSFCILGYGFGNHQLSQAFGLQIKTK